MYIHDCIYCVLVSTMNVHIHIQKLTFQSMPNKLHVAVYSYCSCVHSNRLCFVKLKSLGLDNIHRPCAIDLIGLGILCIVYCCIMCTRDGEMLANVHHFIR